MQIFTCEDRLEDIMTCIYTAWEWALQNSHDRLRLQKEPVEQPTLFDEYSHVEGDREKANKVMRSIQNKIGGEAYAAVYCAAVYHEDALDGIYRFLRMGFAYGPPVMQMLQHPVVMQMMEIRRNVSNEVHRFQEIARFDGMGGGVYVSHIEPKNQIVYPVALHFADRMPSESWMIIDDTRRIAAVHPAEEPIYMRDLLEEEYERLRRTESRRDPYGELWKTFFDAVAISQRVNPKCQRNHFPLWTRTHATEFRDADAAKRAD